MLDQLVDKLDPNESLIDRRILYELTGEKVDLDDKYEADDTDDFDDETHFDQKVIKWSKDIKGSFLASQSDKNVNYDINGDHGDPLL